MTNRNDLPLPPFDENADNPTLESELQHTARIIALTAADLIIHTSDSNLDESNALAELLESMTSAIYSNNQTADFADAFAELIADPIFLDNLDMIAYLDFPLKKYFDFN